MGRRRRVVEFGGRRRWGRMGFGRKQSSVSGNDRFGAGATVGAGEWQPLGKRHV